MTDFLWGVFWTTNETQNPAEIIPDTPTLVPETPTQKIETPIMFDMSQQTDMWQNCKTLIDPTTQWSIASTLAPETVKTPEMEKTVPTPEKSEQSLESMENGSITAQSLHHMEMINKIFTANNLTWLENYELIIEDNENHKIFYAISKSNDNSRYMINKNELNKSTGEMIDHGFIKISYNQWEETLSVYFQDDEKPVYQEKSGQSDPQFDMIKDHIRQKNIFFEEKLNPVYQEIIKKEEAERKVEQEAKEAELRAQQENITQQIINQLNNF